MDLFSSAVAAVGEIYDITMFIRRVVSDMKTYESARRDIQAKLEHELVLLAAFKDLFFDKEAVMRDDRFPVSLKHDVHIILTGLKKALTEYGMLAAKHELLDGEAGLSKELSSALPASLGDRVKLKVKKIRRTTGWALFDKDKMAETLAEYSEWTGRLRQTMSLALLILSAFGSSALQDLAGTRRVQDMGLEDVVARQMLVDSEPPAEFTELPGDVTIMSKPTGNQNMVLAKYDDGWGRAQEVVVEYRKYSKALVMATEFDLPELAQLRQPIRNLAWLLHKATFADTSDEPASPSNQLAIYALPCVGYIDQPDEHITMFLYRIPKPRALEIGLRVTTLHDWINSTVSEQGGGMLKPPLGNRFSIAYTLSLTLLNIHASGWLHKNIWSRGIVIFPSAEPLSHTRSLRVLPYLTGWGLARPITGETDLAANSDVEANFYRHPIRQGYPSAPFKIEHDIYSLGVVLLEIGLWKTVGSIFRKQIDKAALQGQLPPPQKITEALVEKAAGIPSEMGDSYAASVVRCLEGDFGVAEGTSDAVSLPSAFRHVILDVIAEGIKL